MLLYITFVFTMLFFDWENAFVRAKNGMHKHTNQSYLTWKCNYIQIKPLQFAAAAAAAPDKYPTLMFVSRSKSGELFCGDIWEDIICVYTTFYHFMALLIQRERTWAEYTHLPRWLLRPGAFSLHQMHLSSCFNCIGLQYCVSASWFTIIAVSSSCKSTSILRGYTCKRRNNNSAQRRLKMLTVNASSNKICLLMSTKRYLTVH